MRWVREALRLHAGIVGQSRGGVTFKYNNFGCSTNIGFFTFLTLVKSLFFNTKELDKQMIPRNILLFDFNPTTKILFSLLIFKKSLIRANSLDC